MHRSPKIAFFCFEKVAAVDFKLLRALKPKAKVSGRKSADARLAKIIGHSTAFAVSFDVNSPEGRLLAGMQPNGAEKAHNRGKTTHKSGNTTTGTQ